MRRFICIVLIIAGVFGIYVALLGVNMLCASFFVIALGGMLAWFLTRDPFVEPEPTDPQDSLSPFPFRDIA